MFFPPVFNVKQQLKSGRLLVIPKQKSMPKPIFSPILHAFSGSISLSHTLSLYLSLSLPHSQTLSQASRTSYSHTSQEITSQNAHECTSSIIFLTHLNLYFCLTQFYAQTKNKKFSKFIITGGTPENRVTYALVGDKDSYSPNCQTNLFISISMKYMYYFAIQSTHQLTTWANMSFIQCDQMVKVFVQYLAIQNN